MSNPITPGKDLVAVKRSVHFVVPEDFKNTLQNVSRNMCREFWTPLNDRNHRLRKKLRDITWSVWLNGGADTFSMNYLHGTQLVVEKSKKGLYLKLKETGGKLTDLNTLEFYERATGESDDPLNRQVFDQLWARLIVHEGVFPSSNRPVVAAIAQVSMAKYNAPLPVVMKAMSMSFLPSELSNGFLELEKKSMPKEVFPEDLVNAASAEREVERLTYFTFQVKKAKYHEWNMRKATGTWKITPEAPQDRRQTT